ncbi:MAG TPA: hypothetical protein DCG28_06200 [Lachnospiraceae bacterium]|nr:hypothetical protein [Lachnospiraceae bacterium]
MKSILTLTSEGITYLEGDLRNGRAVVTKACKEDLPKNVINNGLINDADTLGVKLSDFISNNRINTKGVDLVIGVGRVLTREMNLPLVKEKELKVMVQNEVYRSVGNEDEYIVDYIVLSTDEVAKTCKVAAYAVTSRVIKSFVDFMKEMNLECKSLDFTTNCLGKLVSKYDSESVVTAAIAINRDAITMALLDRGIPVLSRNYKIDYEMFRRPETMSIAVEELVDHYSRLVQFQTSRNRDEKVSNVYFTGDFDAIGNVNAKFKELTTGNSSVFWNDSTWLETSDDISVNEFAYAIGSLVGRV